MNRTMRPLAVDLDGTLIHSDLLLESFLLLIKRNPLYLLLAPWWLLKGKAALKQAIAQRVELNPAALPYNQPFLTWLHAQKAAGRALWLCTASDQRLAQAVARHLGVFDGVLSSDGTVNLSGSRKAQQLVHRFGSKSFDYCGNARVDLAVWQEAGGAVVVSNSKTLVQAAAQVTSVDAQFEAAKGGARAMLKALRVHQWAKNGLILVPMLAAHRMGDMTVLTQALLAFVAFSLCASSVYLLNDMLDLEADRQHHSKCRRPFAAGSLNLLWGMAMAPVLLVAALLLSLALPDRFMWVLGAYYVATLAYSFSLKRIVMVDVLALAGLYTIRIVAGAAATGIELSFWLLIFAIFIFLSLAIVKRYAELHAVREQGKAMAKGRGYEVDDMHLLQSLGAASGYLSILVLGLYINTPDKALLYTHPKYMWLLVPIMLYWISRVWMLTHRGKMHDDPLVYALKDPASLATGLAAAITLVMAA